LSGFTNTAIDLVLVESNSRRSSSRLGTSALFHQPKFDRIDSRSKHNWDGRRGFPGRERRSISNSGEHRNLGAEQIRREAWKSPELTVRKSILDPNFVTSSLF
jgi:hypothetical protein